MRYGVSFAYFQKDWNCDYLDLIPRVSKLGFQVLEVGSSQLLMRSKSEIADICACARMHGIELIHGFSLGRETDISSEDPQIRNDGLKAVQKVFKLMHAMGSTDVGGINYVGWNCFDPPISRERRFDNSVDCMKKIMKIAESEGIYYQIEVTNGYEQFLLNTAAQAVEYCRAVDSPNLGILLDVNHMLSEEDSFLDAIKTAGSLLRHFHVAQNNRTVPVSAGFLPWEEMAAGFHSIGYDRRIVLEPLVISGGAIGADAKIWRDRTEDITEQGMDQQLEQGLQFVRSWFG